MNPFEYWNPTRLVFGPGSLKKLTSLVKDFRTRELLGTKALIIYGSERVYKSGLLGRVTELLAKAGCEAITFGGVTPNPDLPTLEAAVERVIAEEIDFLVGLGGGSVMDLTKAAAAGAKYKGDLWDMVFHGQEPYNPPEEALPVVMIPTLAATGSEMDPIAVITNPKSRQKSFIRSRVLYPLLSVADPELTLTVPPDQTAYGVSDMISHVTEAYFNGPENTPLQERWAEAVVVNALEYGKQALRWPGDINARTQLQWTSIVALNGWVQAGMDGPYPVHAIEHVFSAFYHVAHGAGLAVLNPAWMLWAAKKRPERFARFAKGVFHIQDMDPLSAAIKGIERLKEEFKGLGLPSTLQELGAREEDWEKLAGTAIETVGKVVEGRKVLPGLIPMEIEDILEVFQLASE